MGFPLASGASTAAGSLLLVRAASEASVYSNYGIFALRKDQEAESDKEILQIPINLYP